jgi:hypothetical protein
MSAPVTEQKVPAIVPQPQGQPVEQEAVKRNVVDRAAVWFVNFARNPVIEGKEHSDRGVAKKALVQLITLVVVVVAAVVVLPGWVFLHYALKEHNSQLVGEKAARDLVPTLQARVTQLEAEKVTAAQAKKAELQTAYNAGKEASKLEGDTAVARTKTNLGNIDAKFRAEVVRIAALPKGKGAELNALLAKDEFKLKA